MSTIIKNWEGAKEYYRNAPEWVWDLTIVINSVEAGLALTQCDTGYKSDGIYLTKDPQSTAVGLLCRTVTRPGTDETYRFEYHGCVIC